MAANEYGVLVAVGANGVHDGALDLAACEAVRRGTGVELIHVVHSLVTAPSSIEQMQSLDQTLTRVGREVLTDAAERLRTRLDGRAPVTTEIATGPVAGTIAVRAADADLLVLERRDTGHGERLLTMSVSTRVAAHTTTPVMVVPEHWRHRYDEAALPVTVGVDRPLDAPGQVETALVYARSSGRPLVILHAAWLAEQYQDLGFRNSTRDMWRHDAERELELALEKVPDLDTVEVKVDVPWRRPVDALVGATKTSYVLVLNRRDEHPLGAHLGPMTRAVLRHAEGPVMIVGRT
ncbi:universal stress protein [Nocardioides sp.]|uniref:universal stress protein n=1 Tax=Nocardioides sp. TaxID=35761 RepID=UPI00378376AA